MESKLTSRETIAAIATSNTIGKGGIAIIRVSGFEAIRSCKMIVETNAEFAWQANRVFYGYVKDKIEDQLIDEILVLVMKEPNSFTGEDTVELHCHGGVISVRRVLDVLLANTSARIAHPGEFSQRAFLNGKIDLTQAESINHLINAKNVRAAEIALNGIRGEIKNKIDAIKNQLIDLLAEIEARVDFDEELEEFDYDNFCINLKDIKNQLKSLIENSNRDYEVNEGISIALIGQTNTGKSSLLNLLAKQKKAIVTNIPGTTRDIIEVNLTIKNLPIKIIDTAGIRETGDLIENIGIQKSLEMITKADYVIYIYDVSKGFDKKDEQIIKKIPNKKLITIIGNKKDLIIDKDINQIAKSNKTHLMSIKNNIGEEELLEKIFIKCDWDQKDGINIFLNKRQLGNLLDCLKNLNDTDKIISNKLPFDLLSIEIRDSIKNLSKLSGEEINEDLLDNIFSKFCIGK